jgi:4-oxalocrotonate tautomerase family enzyme
MKTKYSAKRTNFIPSDPVEDIMPYVNIKITNENVTKEKKVKLIEGITQLLVDVLNKNPATTVVVIDLPVLC